MPDPITGKKTSEVVIVHSNVTYTSDPRKDRTTQEREDELVEQVRHDALSQACRLSCDANSCTKLGTSRFNSGKAEAPLITNSNGTLTVEPQDIKVECIYDPALEEKKQ